MARNKLDDLNNHLFEALERLNDDEYMMEHMQEEIERSKAIAGISKSIVDNARVVLEAQQYVDSYGANFKSLPSMLSVEDGEE